MIKEVEREIIQDLYNVFAPQDERIVKPFVKIIYHNSYNTILKQKSGSLEPTYWHDLMSLAKIHAATQLEKFISGEAEEEAKALLAAADATEGAESVEGPETVADIAAIAPKIKELKYVG